LSVTAQRHRTHGEKLLQNLVSRKRVIVSQDCPQRSLGPRRLPFRHRPI
jgi:hypothetical protein